ncbi:MAG: transglycosylase domain-containing protein [Flavobacterium sp.]|nr:transglycosylase domain-containing protein [Flavobacterium sp.]
MRNKKQKALLFLKIFAITITISLILLFVFRDSLLQTAIAKIENKMANDYDTKLSIEKANFEGISSVQFQKINIVPNNADTLFSVEKVTTKINLFKLLVGTIQLEKLEMKNGFIQLVKNKNGRNFDAFLKQKKEDNSPTENSNYAKSTYRLLTRVLNLIPTEMQLENLSFRMDDMGRKVALTINQLQLKEEVLATTIDVKTNSYFQKWNIKGTANPRDKTADLKFFNSDHSKIIVPYLNERFGLLSSFDSIHLNIAKIEMQSGELHIDGFSSIANLTLSHPKIASKEVVVKKALFDYHFLFGEHFMAIDSSSTIQMNEVKTHPYAEYSTEQDTVYKLKIAIPKMKAQQFITSLPNGLFSHFVGMQTQGNFEYKLDYKFVKHKPKQLVFESKLTKENLRILKYGEANLSKLNSEFTYRAMENGVPQRPIFVGASNPNFTPIDQISPYLQKAVLTCEDPSFFSHRGFINDAFKQSIIKNLKTKRFSRGASTISMQLVKNVFLTREKTLSRKLEEILLVYILENNHISSKQRMLEVYFNVIEWGPNVYGIGEAANFYFSKKPADLTLKECLFLASIVPKPKKFMYEFDTDGFLKAIENKKQTFISNLMLRRRLIIPDDTIGQHLPMAITGSARSFLKFEVKDTIQIDTTFVEEF